MNSRTAQVKTSLESHVAHNNDRERGRKKERENYKRKLFLEFGLKIMSFFYRAGSTRSVTGTKLGRERGKQAN